LPWGIRKTRRARRRGRRLNDAQILREPDIGDIPNIGQEDITLSTCLKHVNIGISFA
jgi:hypothetical protein